MSYTSPRYTYISKQSAFDQLRQDATQAGKTIADKQATADRLKRAEDERKRKINESRLALGRGATQKYLNSVIENSTGNEFEKGAISEYFKGTGKRVGELVMATQGTNPQCEIDGNCDELMEELSRIQALPGQVKTLTENMLDQLDYTDIKNIDPNQPGNYFLAANILKGATGTDPASGYSYSLRTNDKGGTDWVFTFDEAKARESFKDAKPPMTEEEINNQIEAMKFDGGVYLSRKQLRDAISGDNKKASTDAWREWLTEVNGKPNTYCSGNVLKIPKADNDEDEVKNRREVAQRCIAAITESDTLPKEERSDFVKNKMLEIENYYAS